ncbi:dCTP deaminase domain-containing protein [Allomesorhizobium camelthorni]|uniref:Deoxycytidine triphosphate deaminase n=1 Tax=Allomesorhizobium camelthorni TaxID=475069 RepID=A0A6G4WJX5_9HYPH|nr:deoxycytidine triphosphate deaminase [Mesorhizobium camelthorni]NGO54526.1 deoxycytidine triphosphate deaminase [Mesorhizobium camelthorni]
MAFWSSQTLESRVGELVAGAEAPKVDCNSIELTVGREAYVTPNLTDIYTTTKQQLQHEQAFQIPPGQFAFLLTEETVKVPPTAMAFISMKATFKMKGLINVSGFHVDPGWEGPLVFAVFNAGPAPVHLQRGLPLFLIWYADLDHPSEKRKTAPGATTIPPTLISSLTGGNDTLYALDQRFKEGVKKLEEENRKIDGRIHDLRNAQTRNTVMLSVLAPILLGLVALAFKDSIVSMLPARAANVSNNDAMPVKQPVDANSEEQLTDPSR